MEISDKILVTTGRCVKKKNETKCSRKGHDVQTSDHHMLRANGPVTQTPVSNKPLKTS